MAAQSTRRWRSMLIRWINTGAADDRQAPEQQRMDEMTACDGEIASAKPPADASRIQALVSIPNP